MIHWVKGKKPICFGASWGQKIGLKHWKTLRELQNAALRTSHWLSNVSNCLFKKYWESILKKKLRQFLRKSFMIVLTTITTVTAVTSVKKRRKKSLLSQYFWKEQFDTFDNRCDILRAAFCHSRDVFLRLHDFSHSLPHSGCMIFFLEVLWFFCKDVAWILLWKACVIFCVERLHDFFLAERLPNFFWRRGCMIFVFFVCAGCAIFLCRGCTIFFVYIGRVLFLWKGWMVFFLWRGCVL